jgi:hypothetical protein
MVVRIDSSATLISFIKLRNECAHTGTASIVPDTTELSGYCDFLNTLATGIDQVLHHLSVPPFAASALAPAAAAGRDTRRPPAAAPGPAEPDTALPDAPPDLGDLPSS